MAEPTAALVPAPVIGSRFGWTKYLMPLLQPGVVLKSTINSKLEYRSVVMMSPPAADSAPLLFVTINSLSLISHPEGGNVSARALRQPSVVFPSHKRCQPSF